MNNEIEHIKEAPGKVQEMLREEHAKIKDGSEPAATLRGVFVSNDEYVATRNTGVSILYNVFTDSNEEKVKVIDRKTNVSYIVDIPMAVALRLKGLKFREIARYMGCPEKLLFDTISPYLDNDQCTELYEENRASILTSLQARLISGLTPEKIEKASLRDIAVSFGVLFDKERLEKDKSTANVAMGLSSFVDRVHKKTEEQEDNGDQ
jgi:hypothetical protein